MLTNEDVIFLYIATTFKELVNSPVALTVFKFKVFGA